MTSPPSSTAVLQVRAASAAAGTGRALGASGAFVLSYGELRGVPGPRAPASVPAAAGARRQQGGGAPGPAAARTAVVRPAAGRAAISFWANSVLYPLIEAMG